MNESTTLCLCLGNTGFDLGECNTTCGFGSRVDSINCTFYPYDCYYGPPPTRVEPCFSEPCQPPGEIFKEPRAQNLKFFKA